MMREIAWRIFSGEFNDSDYVYSEGGERSPSYVITPLGAKINRLFVVGVITDVENIGTEIQPMWRARLSDPTGIYFLSAGQYQPEAATILSGIKPPMFAAVMGKSRVYSPDENTFMLSIRVEMIKEVEAAVRDYWILEACGSLKRRLEAIEEAVRMDPLTRESLVALGYGVNLSDGIVRAMNHYREVDTQKYQNMLRQALQYLLPDFEPAVEETIEEVSSREPTELESKVLEYIRELDRDGKGALWDDILRMAKSDKMGKEELEGAMNGLLDKGLVFEPILGRMKCI